MQRFITNINHYKNNIEGYYNDLLINQSNDLMESCKEYLNFQWSCFYKCPPNMCAFFGFESDIKFNNSKTIIAIINNLDRHDPNYNLTRAFWVRKILMKNLELSRQIRDAFIQHDIKTGQRGQRLYEIMESKYTDYNNSINRIATSQERYNSAADELKKIGSYTSDFDLNFASTAVDNADFVALFAG